MRKIILTLILSIIVAHALIATSIDAQVMDNQVVDINALIDKVESEIPSGYRGPVAIIEMRTTLDKIEAYKDLQKKIADLGSSLTASVDQIATDDNNTAIFFRAAQILDVEEYSNLVSHIIDNHDSYKISDQQYLWALFPSDKKLRNMWTSENPPSSLLELARRAEDFFSSDNETQQFFTNFISRVEKGEEANSPVNKTEESNAMRSITEESSGNSLIEPAEFAAVESPDESAEKSSNWWLWLIGLLIIAGGLAVVLRRKS